MTDSLTKNLAFLLQGDKSRQTALAAKAGTTQPTISKWSRLHASQSKAEPEFRSMARLCAALGVSLDDLAFRDIETAGPSVQSQPVGFDDATMAQAVELLYLMRDARPEDGRLVRPTWAMFQIAAKGIELAEGDARKAMSYILEELAKES